MYDQYATPTKTQVATTALTVINASECRLDSIIITAARATTDTIAIYDATATAVGTVAAALGGVDGTKQPVTIPFGCRMDDGIVVKAVANTEFVVVYTIG